MLKISDNHRFLVRADGRPFFWLADTGWEIFHRLDRADAEMYLRDRAAKRFTVIQAVVLAEYDGLHAPNPYGHTPLVDDDPTQPNDAYFKHVDDIVAMATGLGLTMAMVATWGDKWNRKWGVGPEVFTPENARAYGRWLGARYRDADLVWVLGGDRPIESARHRQIMEQMALGLREGDGGSHLITFHPVGSQSSAQDFHDAAWLDFNMWQSGHNRNRDNYACIASDYARIPTKPCLDAENGYEDHPAGFDIANGYLDDYDVRRGAYWALFAGAFGHTYGCHPIWQFASPRFTPASFCRLTWQEVLQLPGAGQMQHARALLESRPFLTRIPDQSLIASDPAKGPHHMRATRDIDGRYAFIYFPTVRSATIDLEKLSGETLIGHWYNPRNGQAQPIGEIARMGKREFTTPAQWPDWVLVLDDAAQNFGPPGRAYRS